MEIVDLLISRREVVEVRDNLNILGSSSIILPAFSVGVGIIVGLIVRVCTFSISAITTISSSVTIVTIC